jgi:hypothetical protein
MLPGRNIHARYTHTFQNCHTGHGKYKIVGNRQDRHTIDHPARFDYRQSLLETAL